MNLAVRQAAITFGEWAIIWGPIVDKARREAAWRLLELPGPFNTLEQDYWSAFQIGSPQPKISLLLHAALGMEGGHAREEWMRVFQFLSLTWRDSTLAPDHLAPACEALAVAIEHGDDVLMTEICHRYLMPWCERARETLQQDGSNMLAVAERFESDLTELL